MKGIGIVETTGIADTIRFTSDGTGNVGVVYVGACNILGAVVAADTHTVARTLLLFDKATTPVDGDLPIAVSAILAANGTQAQIIINPFNLQRCSVGLAWGISTSTLSLVTTGLPSNNARVYVRYFI